jgi:hypothetical protein
MKEMMMCQIVNENGVPANDYIYTDLELAEEMCNNLVENYNEYYTVRILTPYPKKSDIKIKELNK